MRPMSAEPISDELRTRVWDRLVDAKRLEYYYQARCARSHRVDRWILWLQLILSSGAVASLALRANFQLLSVGLTLAVALLSSLQLVRRTANFSGTALKLQEEWAQHFQKVDCLWLDLQQTDVDPKDIRKRYEELACKVSDFDKLATAALPADDKLSKQAMELALRDLQPSST